MTKREKYLAQWLAEVSKTHFADRLKEKKITGFELLIPFADDFQNLSAQMKP